MTLAVVAEEKAIVREARLSFDAAVFDAAAVAALAFGSHGESSAALSIPPPSPTLSTLSPATGLQAPHGEFNSFLLSCVT